MRGDAEVSSRDFIGPFDHLLRPCCRPGRNRAANMSTIGVSQNVGFSAFSAFRRAHQPRGGSVQSLARRGATPRPDDDKSVQESELNGCIEGIRLMLPRKDPRAWIVAVIDDDDLPTDVYLRLVEANRQWAAQIESGAMSKTCKRTLIMNSHFRSIARLSNA